jgi:hypothetical protein
MALPTAIYPEFKLNPFFFARAFKNAARELLRATLPDIDWQARKTHQAAVFDPQGLNSLEWAMSHAEWTIFVTGQGRAAGRRGHGIQTAVELDWPAGANDLQIARAKADHKHQSVLTDALPAAKKHLLDLALMESPDEFAASFRKLPVANQTMLTLLTMVEAQYYEVPPDEIERQLAQMHEPWVATEPPRVFTARLLS